MLVLLPSGQPGPSGRRTVDAAAERTGADRRAELAEELSAKSRSVPCRCSRPVNGPGSPASRGACQCKGAVKFDSADEANTGSRWFLPSGSRL